jgi:Bacteriophage Mu, Gp27
MSGQPPTAAPAAPKKRRVQRPGKMRHMPPALRQELDEHLKAGDLTCRGLSALLEERGFEISPTGINYYQHKFDDRLRAVELASKQAGEIVKAAGGDDDRINRALARLVQSTMFEMVIEMYDARRKFEAAERARSLSSARLAARARRAGEIKQEADGAAAAPDDAGEPAAKFPAKAELSAMGAIGRTVAALGKLDLEWEKWRAQMKIQVKRQVDAAGERVSDAVKNGGLSAEAEARIRSALLEIKV